MYINEQNQTCNRQLIDQTTGEFINWPMTDEAASQYMQYRPFTKVVFSEDEDGNKYCSEVQDDTEAREAYELEQQPTDEELLEEAQDDARIRRNKLFKAFDTYKSNVQYGIITETEEEHAAVLEWYQQILDITDTVVVGEETVFPEIPAGVADYVQTRSLTRAMRERNERD